MLANKYSTQKLNFKFVSVSELHESESGRLKLTELSLKCHSQVIIDKHHTSAALLIKYHHITNLHFGREQTLSSIRKKYWITLCRGLTHSFQMHPFSIP